VKKKAISSTDVEEQVLKACAEYSDGHYTNAPIQSPKLFLASERKTKISLVLSSSHHTPYGTQRSQDRCT